MKKKKTYNLILLSIFMLFLSTELFSQKTAINGLLDISKYEFSKDGLIDLNGTWEFYPEKLYTPKDFYNKNTIKAKIVNVPSLWDSTFFDSNDNVNLKHGTYRLKIKVSDKIELLALRLNRIETSYTLWIDGDSLISCGIPGAKKADVTPAQKTIFKVFVVHNSTFYITLQVANFHHRKGGIDSPISIGLPTQIISKTKTSRGFELFIIGVLLIMGLFHFGLYIVKRKELSLLFFGLFLLSEMVSMMTNGEVLFTYFFPDMPWYVLKKIDFISNFVRATFFALFFFKLYERYLSKRYFQVFTALNIILTIIVLSTSLLNYAFTLFIFIVTTTLTLFYILFAQIKSVIRKKEGALIPFLGTVVLMFTAINDILYVSDIIETMFLTPFGLFIFIFSQSYILSFSFSNLYKKTEDLNKMTADLDDIKNRLLAEQSFEYINYLKILTEYSKATRGLLFSVIDGHSVLKSEYPKTETLENRVPLNIINDVLKKEEIFIMSGLNLGKNFENSYFSSFQPKSATCIPLKASGKIRAILYFENINKRNAFIKKHIDIFKHLSDQIIGIIDRQEMYIKLENLNLNLEKTIKSRTKDIRQQNEMLEEQKEEIDAATTKLNSNLEELSEKNKIITNSIKYAAYLQEANLPDEDYINSMFKENFILFRPKETVSGDFYWAKKIKDDNGNENVIFALADCTGHGIPGALISVIGYDLLNNAVLNKKIYKPSEILNNIQEKILRKLGADNEKQIKDGMEIAIITYNKKDNTLSYAGAKINLIIFRNGKMTEVKADKIPITAVLHEKQQGQKFTNNIIQLKKDDVVYLYSDGFQDQFGGKKDMKFMKKNFRALLEETNKLSFNVQRSHLLKALNHWQGKNIQNDDILVVGLKF